MDEKALHVRWKIQASKDTSQIRCRLGGPPYASTTRMAQFFDAALFDKKKRRSVDQYVGARLTALISLDKS